MNLNVGLGFARKGFDGKYDNNFNSRSRRSFKRAQERQEEQKLRDVEYKNGSNVELIDDTSNHVVDIMVTSTEEWSFS